MDVLIGFFIIVLYLLSGFVAILRGHHQWLAITVLDVLLGWTALGWVAALVWSLTAIPPGRAIS